MKTNNSLEIGIAKRLGGHLDITFKHLKFGVLFLCQQQLPKVYSETAVWCRRHLASEEGEWRWDVKKSTVSSTLAGLLLALHTYMLAHLSSVLLLLKLKMPWSQRKHTPKDFPESFQERERLRRRFLQATCRTALQEAHLQMTGAFFLLIKGI